MTAIRGDASPTGADRDRAPLLLEICVDTLAGARAAIAGGADRIELCATLALGGLTPSAGLVRAVLDLARPAGVAVRAMVRPCPGGFDYDDDMLAVAIAEGRALVAEDVDGLVFGVMRGRRLDRARLAAWRAAVTPPALTIHRAIDLAEDPVAAIDDAIAVGADQVLSSGGAETAPRGVATLQAMAACGAGRLGVIAGAGVTPDDVAALVAAGVGAVHASAGGAVPATDAAATRLGFGAPPRPTDAARVRALAAAVRAADSVR